MAGLIMDYHYKGSRKTKVYTEVEFIKPYLREARAYYYYDAMSDTRSRNKVNALRSIKYFDVLIKIGRGEHIVDSAAILGTNVCSLQKHLATAIARVKNYIKIKELRGNK